MEVLLERALNFFYSGGEMNTYNLYRELEEGSRFEKVHELFSSDSREEMWYPVLLCLSGKH